MQAKIINFRGVSNAEINIDSIALIAGTNGAGKSSICQALAAALTGDPIPLLGVKKTGAGVLVRSGTSAGKIDLITEAGTTEITWPAAKCKTTGAPPTASKYAAGLESIVTLEEKSRVTFLIDYLHAKPTKVQLQAAIAILSLPTGTVDKLWELIELQGWDGAYSQIKEKGAKYKGQWELITNDNYGSKKAEAWIPEGYSPDLQGASEVTLKACVTDARDALEAVIADSAVDDSKRADLEIVAELLESRQQLLTAVKSEVVDRAVADDLEKQLAEAQGVVIDAGRVSEALREGLKNLESPPEKSKPYDRMHCPQCKSLLHLKEKILELVAEEQVIIPDPALIDDCKKRLADAEGTVAEVTAVRDDLQAKYKTASDDLTSCIAEHTRQVYEAERLVKESQAAVDELAKPGPSGSGRSVEECRNDVAAAELRLSAFQKKTGADALQASIELNQALLGHIAPSGVRADVLTLALDGFNKRLRHHSDVASWPTVAIDSDFSFTFGGSSYYLLSMSEQFRVRAVVQVAMAVREKAGAVIVDGADILDKQGRNGLFRMVVDAGLPALVGMTIDVQENVPNLAKAGIGRAYWLESSVAREV